MSKIDQDPRQRGNNRDVRVVLVNGSDGMIYEAVPIGPEDQANARLVQDGQHFKLLPVRTDH